MTTRRRSPGPRPRRYITLVNSHDSNTSTTREAIATPKKGTRIRVVRVRVIQETADGRQLYELYFGTGATITTNPTKAVDILEVNNLGADNTRTWNRDSGPRGDRDEVLSGRWINAPTSVHKVNVEYTEDP